MNATHVSTMIFSDDQLKAESKMNELIRYLPEKTIIRRKKDYVKTVLGTYQAKKYSDNCRGLRYQEVYIDKTLWDNAYDVSVIIMKLRPPCFDERNTSEKYNWKDYVHFF
ncbi:hypothetical protein HUB98_05945 [Paenibacillus barcinonensis]|uniref:Uncharacterized protein n=1 Tax=Paenibacillus barcinonensis TaxID=198119 RepID=A0A2V4WT64_PAEBA|nr:hypothetical protein [Paenibacillus barcinonensis]PYE51549.1 hypothetical protein DFQ00_102343 [Paenibacillus barcinonensis]QKS55923.1 hypothetical protein HUB98_05945 [Paenibacillus barcinonensis]